jgi:hypothetical protein
MGRLMSGRTDQDILVATERVHAESDNAGFLESQWKDLVENGAESEAFKYGIAKLANENANLAEK